MIQKIINVMAITSFAVSAGIVAGGYMIYHNQDEIVKEIQDTIIEGVAEVIPDMVVESLDNVNPTENLSPF